MVVVKPGYVQNGKKENFLITLCVRTCKVSELCIVADKTVECKCRLNNKGISLAIYTKTKVCFILAV